MAGDIYIDTASGLAHKAPKQIRRIITATTTSPIKLERSNISQSWTPPPASIKRPGALASRIKYMVVEEAVKSLGTESA